VVGKDLDDLQNVDLSTPPTDGQYIRYDNASGNWIASNVDGLDAVTSVGGVTTNPVTVGSFTSTGIDDNAASTALTIDTSGNVGIGTSSPFSELEVVADAGGAPSISLLSSGVERHQIIQGGVGDGGLHFYNQTAGAERMRIASNGNVGIGTSNPAAKLDVSGDFTLRDTGFPRITLIDSDGVNTQSFIDHSGESLSLTAQNGTSNGIIRFAQFDGTSTAERMRISPGGRVGINELSPGALLHVSDAAVGANVDLAILQNTSAAGVGAGASIVGKNNADINVVRLGWALDSTDASNLDGGAWVFSTRKAGTSLSERMRIDSNGRVGIGAVPGAIVGGVVGANQNFVVDGTIGQVQISNTGNEIAFSRASTNYISATSASANLKYVATNAHIFDTNSSEVVRIDSSGNVGIGTSNPAYSLHIGDGTATEILAIQASNTGTSHIFFGDASDVDAGRVSYAHDVDAFIFSNNGNQERMRIHSNGDLLVNQSAYDYANIGGRISGRSNEATSFTNSGVAALFVRRNAAATNDPVAVFSEDANTIAFVRYDGGTSGSFVNSSDQRLKENIRDAESAGDIIDSLRVRQFNWKRDGKFCSHDFIAQEVYEAYPPAAAEGGEDPVTNPWAVSKADMVPLLVKEVQSLRARVAQLEA